MRQITANNNGSIAPVVHQRLLGVRLPASRCAASVPNNTLVLVNGRRMANFGLADDGHASYVDLSQIPFDAVERIEVLKDGASAIYGSDAVAGVVNVILRQQFTGVTATGTARHQLQRRRQPVQGARSPAGIGDLTKDRYNAFITFDYQKQEAIPMNKGQRLHRAPTTCAFMGWRTSASATRVGFGTGSLVGIVRPVNPATGGSSAAAVHTRCPGATAPPGNVDRDGLLPLRAEGLT